MTDTELAKKEEFEFKPLARIGSGANAKALLKSTRMHDALHAILPAFSDDADPEKHIVRLIAQAGLAFMQNTKLNDCTELSVFDSMMHVAETGLSLSKQSGEAYLVPFRDNKNGVTNCQFMPGYRGLIKLSVQTGGVTSVDAVCVFKGEDFEYYEDEGGARIRHKPDLDGQRLDADILYVYCRIQTSTGGRIVTVMNRKQVERIRNNSKSPNSPAWKQHWGEMARKTCIKRGLKTIPQSVEDKHTRILERAIDLDNHAGGFIDAEIIGEERAKLQAERDADWQRRVGREEVADVPKEPERAEDGEVIPDDIGKD